MSDAATVRSGGTKIGREKRTRSTVVMRGLGGRIVRLTDPEMRPGVEALKKRLTDDPVAARKWLEELGYLTPSGNVTKRYSVR